MHLCCMIFHYGRWMTESSVACTSMLQRAMSPGSHPSRTPAILTRIFFLENDVLVLVSTGCYPSSGPSCYSRTRSTEGPQGSNQQQDTNSILFVWCNFIGTARNKVPCTMWRGRGIVLTAAVASLCLACLSITAQAAIVEAEQWTNVIVEAPLYDSQMTTGGGCDPAGCLGMLTRVGSLVTGRPFCEYFFLFLLTSSMKTIPKVTHEPPSYACLYSSGNLRGSLGMKVFVVDLSVTQGP